MNPTSSGKTLAAFAAHWGPRIEGELDRLLPPMDEAPAELHAAMRYALFPGGKRLRPLLCLCGAAAAGGDPEKALRAAAGIECLHTYSLVHDDLPCMDDDDLRRGRATCHKVFGEATALLVGDALLTLAFEAAASAGAPAVLALAQAAGSRGMVGGQKADLEAEGAMRTDGLEQVQWIHDRKTGALITGSLLVGACSAMPVGEALPPRLLDALRRYGDMVGRAFQIADDCLDLTGTAAELGKNPMADVGHGKLTWPAVVGLEESRRMAQELAEGAAALAEEITAAAREGRPAGDCALDGVQALLQDLAFAAVLRRS